MQLSHLVYGDLNGRRVRRAVGPRDWTGLDLDAFTAFRNWRNVARSTQGKERETLRAFCKFAMRRKWLLQNHATDLEAPRDDAPPTMPFEQCEISALLNASERMEDNNNVNLRRAKLRNRALILVLLYSGLRISDAVKLERRRVDLTNGKILLRMMKTRHPLYGRLHPDAVDALNLLCHRKREAVTGQVDGTCKRERSPTQVSRYVRGRTA